MVPHYLPEELVETAAEGKQHEDVEEEELHYVHHHARQGHLQRAQMRIHREDVDQLQTAEDVGRTEQALRDEHRVPGIPFLSWQISRRLILLHLFLDLRIGSRD